MDFNSDMEMEERRPFGQDTGWARMRKTIGWPSPFVISAIGVIIALLIFTIFLRGGGKDDSQQIKGITARLGMVEERLLQYAPFEEKLGQLERKIAALQKVASTSNAGYQSLAAEIAKINKQVEALTKAVLSFPKPTETPGTVQRKKRPQDKKSYHEVRKGENLYGIAKRYGMSVAELRKMNKLPTGKTIYPGQKLLIK